MNEFSIIGTIGYLLLAPVAGGFLSGLEHFILNKIREEKGGDLLKPFRDIAEQAKQSGPQEEKKQSAIAASFFVITVLSGCFFFAGGSLAVTILLSTLSGIVYAGGIYVSQSDNHIIKAESELLRTAAHLTFFYLTAFGFYLLVGFDTGRGSFNVSDVINLGVSAAFYLPGMLVGIVSLIILLPRTSLIGNTDVSGYSGRNLVFLEVGRWYENILLLGFVFLLNYGGTAISAVITTVICLLIYFLRMFMTAPLSGKNPSIIIYTAELIALILSFVNIVVLLS